AIHHMGLVTLTHTPSPMGFLSEVLGRPENERAFLVMPVGYPAADAKVPDIRRKPLDAIALWNEGRSSEAGFDAALRRPPCLRQAELRDHQLVRGIVHPQVQL